MDNPTPLTLAIRHFHRFYTKRFGLLNRRLLHSAYSLVEARILYEIAHSQAKKASVIATDLGIDAGYLSRILKRFEALGLIAKQPCPIDGRSMQLIITEQGKAEFEMMAERVNKDVKERIKHLSIEQQKSMLKAMQDIETAFDAVKTKGKTAIIRSHRPGDMGWILQAHGQMYQEEFGFNENFEALVARIVADFISKYDIKSEHCWIAEMDNTNVGCVFIVREDDTTAKLRLLLIDQKARGMGLGKQLVDECIRFAKRAGYTRMTLWTNDGLTTARRIYENAGFELVSQKAHTDFGTPQVGQHWLLEF